MMMRRMRAVVFGAAALSVMACEKQESSAADSADPATDASTPTASGGEPSGTVIGEPFATQGVLAHRRRSSDPTVEIRLMSREASCDDFDADYRADKDEPVVVMYMKWPHAKGDTIPLKAAQTEERLQFCKGKGGEKGRVRCEPRDPEQGSVKVLDASPTGGTLSFDVASSKGKLSGSLEFELCER